MVDKQVIAAMRKKRDIARAYFDKEGSIADLATRFHASSNTVQAAIKHDADWWQAEIEKLITSALASPSTPLHQHLLITLVKGRAVDGGPGYTVSTAEAGMSANITMSLTDIMDRASQAGWEIVQVMQNGAGEFTGIIVRRPVG